jgi:hypothetical protein
MPKEPIEIHVGTVIDVNLAAYLNAKTEFYREITGMLSFIKIMALLVFVFGIMTPLIICSVIILVPSIMSRLPGL